MRDQGIGCVFTIDREDVPFDNERIGRFARIVSLTLRRTGLRTRSTVVQ